MVGPMVVSSDLVDARQRYLGTNDFVHDVNFFCFDALGEVARVALAPGRHVRVDLIVRAAVRPCGCMRSAGVCHFESPLIVGFSLNPSDVERAITAITRSPAFHGQCIRGYIVLRDSQELGDILTVVP